MSSVHALSSLVRLVTSLRGADFWSCVSSAKSRLMVYRVVRYVQATYEAESVAASAFGQLDKSLCTQNMNKMAEVK